MTTYQFLRNFLTEKASDLTQIMSNFFSDLFRQFVSSIHFPPFMYDRCSSLKVNRHARCISDHLHALLTYTDLSPALIKQSKPCMQQLHPHCDKTAGFYQAQLVHHGLKSLKTKGSHQEHSSCRHPSEQWHARPSWKHSVAGAQSHGAIGGQGCHGWKRILCGEGGGGAESAWKGRGEKRIC